MGEGIFVGTVSAVEFSIPLFSLWDALGDGQVSGVARHIASVNTSTVSELVLLVVVAGLVAGLRQVERRPSAVSTTPPLPSAR